MFEKKEYDKGSKITLSEALDFSLYIASLGQGLVEPNPCVGAVLIDEKKNELVSYGHHKAFGEAHAEVNCLRGIDDAEGLTLIVTLEPCSHYGKTPPCADLVIEKNIKKLIYISKDPNPLVSGKGLDKIAASGIEVEKSRENFEVKNELLNHKFFYAMRNKKTYVHLKWAESRDGKTIVKKGSSWITGDESKDHVHFLRAQSQAVLIGRGTLEKDDPFLNVRKKGFEKDLKVIVFDPFLKSLDEVLSKNICKARGEDNLIYLCEKKPKDESEISFLELKRKEDKSWDLARLSEELYSEFKIQSVFVEGGAHTLNKFIEQGVYNRVSKYTASHDLSDNGEGEIKAIEASHVAIKESKGRDSLIDMFFKGTGEKKF